MTSRLIEFSEIVGEWSVKTLRSGDLALDGGAMFGSVPRPVWERMIPPDVLHRIPLALRLLLLENSENGRTVLVDAGAGNKEDEAFRERFAISGSPLLDTLREIGVEPEKITDVLITHLHFDHAGGLTLRDSSGELRPAFPGAKHYLQRANRATALEPNARERASYLRENIEPLEAVDLELIDGDAELLSGLRVERSDGHTDGMQTVRIEGGGRVIRYLADLAPTHHHMRLPFTMGYDICARTVMEEKQRLIAAAREEDAILLFEHDPVIAAAKLVEKKGRIVAEAIGSVAGLHERGE